MTLVLVDQRGPARWLWLNRPERRNALDPSLVQAFQSALTDAMADNATSVVVVAGMGRSFCAGADLRHLLEVARAGANPMDFLSTISRCFTSIEQAQKPVIAVLHGHVVAGGLELALACDVVVAETGTLIGDGHVRNGLLPGGGASVRLPRKVGEPLARWLMLSGQLLPAETFLATGLVHDVVPAEQIEKTVAEIVDTLDSAGERTAGRVKELLQQWHEHPTHEALGRELAVLRTHWHDTDIERALTRFVDRKREDD